MDLNEMDIFGSYVKSYKMIEKQESEEKLVLIDKIKLFIESCENEDIKFTLKQAELLNEIKMLLDEVKL